VNQRNLSIAWLATILLLSVFAGFSWQNAQLTPEAGGQGVEITGYSAFPIISALVLLQAASMLASFLTPVIVGRWIAGLLSLLMLGHAVLLTLTLDAGIQSSLARLLSEITGVSGSASQIQFVVSLDSSFLWVGYLAAVAINVIFLVGKALLNLKPTQKSSSVKQLDEAGDLWESQK